LCYAVIIYTFNFSGEAIFESEIRPLYLKVNDTEAYEIETSKLNIGVKIKAVNDVIDIGDLSEYLNVYFASYNSSTREVTKYESVPCSSLFFDVEYRNNET